MPEHYKCTAVLPFVVGLSDSLESSPRSSLFQTNADGSAQWLPEYASLAEMCHAGMKAAPHTAAGKTAPADPDRPSSHHWLLVFFVLGVPAGLALVGSQTRMKKTARKRASSEESDLASDVGGGPSKKANNTGESHQPPTHLCSQTGAPAIISPDASLLILFPPCCECVLSWPGFADGQPPRHCLGGVDFSADIMLGSFMQEDNWEFLDDDASSSDFGGSSADEVRPDHLALWLLKLPSKLPVQHDESVHIWRQWPSVHHHCAGGCTAVAPHLLSATPTLHHPCARLILDAAAAC